MVHFRAALAFLQYSNNFHPPSFGFSGAQQNEPLAWGSITFSVAKRNHQ